MNVAYYVLIFDHATDALLEHLKMGPEYREKSAASIFVVESHVTYEQEIMEGTSVSVNSRIMGFDAKRLHIFHHMTETGSGITAATNEVMILHMDMTTRRVAPFPEFAQLQMAELLASHNAIEKPKQAGRTIAIPEKKKAS
jgi:acyl-CoA thioester hydrolase